MSDEQPKEQTNDNNGVDQTNLEEQVKEDYRFNTKIAKEAIQETLLEHLKDREYSQIEAEPLSKTISREIKERLKDHCLENRYKLMVQVVLGERNGAGTRFEACCIWDDDTDTQASDKGRRTIENTFGIMASKWRVFRKPIISGRNTVEAITKAAVVLHNFIKMSENNAGVRYYSGPLDIEPDEVNRWATLEMGALRPVNQLGTNTYSANAKMIRNKLKDHFSGEVAVAFQYERLVK